MTHTTELDNLENRLRNSGWHILLREVQYLDHQLKIAGDLDLVAMKINNYGVNYVYFEMKGGRK
jgi:hypothetical protein